MRALRLFLLALLIIPLISATPKPYEGTNAHMDNIHFYIANPEITARFGTDPKPVGKYINDLYKALDELLADAPRPRAKGLLIGVGVKSKDVVGIWCEAVDGDCPAELLSRIEEELAKVEAFDMKQAPGALGFCFSLYGRKPSSFPEFPTEWVKAHAANNTQFIVPPDEIFKIIWPDTIPKSLIIVLVKDMEKSHIPNDLQRYVINSEAVIPLFSSKAAMAQSLHGESLVRPTKEVSRSILASLLNDNQVYLLDPGLPTELRFTAAQLQQAVMTRSASIEEK